MLAAYHAQAYAQYGMHGLCGHGVQHFCVMAMAFNAMMWHRDIFVPAMASGLVVSFRRSSVFVLHKVTHLFCAKQPADRIRWPLQGCAEASL